MGVGYSDRYVAFFVLASLLFGYGISVLNTIAKHVTIMFEWCGDAHTPKCKIADDRFALATTMLFIGAAVGSLCGGQLCSRGRRLALAVTHGVFVVGGIVCGTAVGVITFDIGRFLLGLAVGFSTVIVPMYISEMSPVAVRGSRGVGHQLFITIGILIGIALGLGAASIPTNPTSSFVLTTFQKRYVRLMLAAPALISVIALALIWTVFTDESPTYLVAEDQAGKAGRVLQKIYARDDIEAELKDIVLANEQNRRLKDTQLVSFGDFVKKYIFVIVFAIILSIGQQISGINVFVALSTKIFEGAGLPPQYSPIASTAMAVVNCLMTFPPIFMVEKFGRRSLLLAAVAGQTIFLCLYPIIASLVSAEVMTPGLPTVSLSSMVAVVSVLGFIICFALGYGPVLWLYLPEVFPPEIKGIGAGLASAANWIACIGIVAFGSLFQSDVVKFSVFAGGSAFSLIWIAAFMRETKGRAFSPYFPAEKGHIRMADGGEASGLVP